MATVTGKTSDKIDDLMSDMIVNAGLDSQGALTFQRQSGQVINAGSLGASIVSATINGAKHLIFTKMQGGTVDAGSVDLSSPLDAWPVGAIYISMVATSPATLFGGTWARLAKGRMLMGVDEADASFDAVRETGGSKTKTIAATNLPAHQHSINHDHSTQSRPQAGSIASLLAQGGGAATIEQSTAVNAFNGSSGPGPGTAAAFDVMNPYITAYIWERTA